MKYHVLILGVPVAAVFLAVLQPAAPPVFAQKAEDRKLANRVRDILDNNCSKCHGASKKAGTFDVRSWKTLVVKQDDNTYYVAPKKLDDSYVWSRVGVAKDMPPNPGPISEDEQKAIKSWIEAGAPEWEPAAGLQKKREFISVRETLSAVLADLREAEPEDRPYLRYFTFTHLHNNPEVTEQQLQLFRAALSKALNSMHWRKPIVLPRVVDKFATVLAVDLRDLDWDRKRVGGKLEPQDRWSVVADAYFYGLSHRDPDDERLEKVQRDLDRIANDGKIILRGDWFIARATRPPVYEQVLRLPRTDAELEQKLGVDVFDNFRRNRLARAGYVKSGVSAQNRMVERHDSLYGAYWKSYDFKKGAETGNLLKSPLGPASFQADFARQGRKYPFAGVAFRHDGGEMIFHLPNGMQGYFLVNGKGEFITKGPIEVVQDTKHEASGTTEIINGLSCMVCHKEGMIYSIKDDVRNGTPLDGGELLRKVRALYVPQPQMLKWARKDGDQFLSSLREAMLPFLSAEDRKKKSQDWPEPIYELLKNYYYPGVNLERAAYELGMKDPAELKAAIRNNDRLVKLGFKNLANGKTISREEWDNADKLDNLKSAGQSYFQKAAQALRLGVPIQ